MVRVLIKMILVTLCYLFLSPFPLILLSLYTPLVMSPAWLYALLTIGYAVIIVVIFLKTVIPKSFDYFERHEDKKKEINSS